MNCNIRFKELLTEGLKRVAVSKRANLGTIEQDIGDKLSCSYHNVRRWRRGLVPRDPERVEFLVRYCVEHGRLDIEWAKDILRSASYQDSDKLLADIFPNQVQHIDIPIHSHNLPSKHFNLIGRDLEFNRVLEGLNSHCPLISIVGLPGIGKTALAIEVGYACLNAANTQQDLTIIGNQVSRTEILRFLTVHFNESELRALCFDLDIDYENLSEQGKRGKARELVEYTQRHGLLTKLVRVCQCLRPNIDWQQIVQTALPERSQESKPSSNIFFDFIVWASSEVISGKKHHFNIIVNKIAEVLHYDYILNLTDERKLEEIGKIVQRYRILIIIDNLDAIDDIRLRKLFERVQSPSKILITSRTIIYCYHFYCIHLGGLSYSDAAILIRNRAKFLELKDIEHAEQEDLMPLIQVTSGHPKVIEIVLSQVRLRTLEGVVEHIRQGKFEDIFYYVVEWVWETVHEDARQVLMVMFFFMDVSQEVLASVADLGEQRFEQALKQLVDTALLNVVGEIKKHDRRYSIHPIVRIFLKQQLEDHQTWEAQARQRWATCYLEFVERRVLREQIKEQYWRYLGGGRLMAMGQEWDNLQLLLEWADSHRHHRLLLDLMLRLVHYMDRRAFYPTRLEYASKAATASRELGEAAYEALFRIDALGLTLRKIGRHREALAEINAGLDCLAQLDSGYQDVLSLQALGYTFKSKVYIEMDDLQEASTWIDKAIELELHCIPVIRHRILVTAGDLAYRREQYRHATNFYLRGREIGISYSTEGDTDLAGVYRKLGFSYLALHDLDQAEAEFNKVLVYKKQGGVLNDIQARFGLAKVMVMRKQHKRACELALDAKADLSRLSIEHPLLKEIEQFLNTM